MNVPIPTPEPELVEYAVLPKERMFEYDHPPFSVPECPPEQCNHHRDELPKDCDCFNISPLPEQNL